MAYGPSRSGMSRIAWVAAVAAAVGLAGGVALKGVLAQGSDHHATPHGIETSLTGANDLLVDSAMLCVDARQYIVTDVSAADHRMIAVRRNGQPATCTGGVTLTVDETIPATELAMAAVPASGH